MPRRRVAPSAARPPPPATSPIKGTHLHHPSSLSLASCPHRPTELPPPRRLHAHRAIVSPPSVSSAAPPPSAPFGQRLTSPVLSSSCRTRRRPPRPLELRCRPRTPPAVSGENPAAPPCPAQPPSAPRGVPTGRATPRPPAKPRWPCHRAAARVANAR
jgi:hypothetical protein